MFAPTFTALGAVLAAALPSGGAMVALAETSLLEAVAVAAAALACGILVRLVVDARTPPITLRVVPRPKIPRAA
ncbi:MAG: hypothetical protein E6J70_17635 [Deltaproteobacteria bacterium]|nr:MAG: hypothetical protein E6J70_17635 [Deltaproteobacteria bacterium]